jgi:conjugative transposon TraN protein
MKRAISNLQNPMCDNPVPVPGRIKNWLSDFKRTAFSILKQTMIVPIIYLFTLIPLCGGAQPILQLSDKKSIHVVCPDKVLYVRCGDETAVEAEILPELSNIIRVKAQKPFEGQTSLAVVCSGRIYAVAAQFGKCEVLTYQLETLPSEKAIPFSGKLMPDSALKAVSNRVLSQRGQHSVHCRTEKNGIQMEIRTICIKGDALFLELEVTNRTNMAFDAETFNFWISDRRQQRATNVQEYQFYPDYSRFELKRVPSGEKAKEVFVIEKLTIPDKRVLRIEMLEKAPGNTGRKLTLELKNRDLRKAGKI